MSFWFMSVFLISPAFSASASFSVSQVWLVGVFVSFSSSAAMPFVVGVCCFWALVTAFIELVLCWKFSVEV